MRKNRRFRRSQKSLLSKCPKNRPWKSRNGTGHEESPGWVVWKPFGLEQCWGVARTSPPLSLWNCLQRKLRVLPIKFSQVSSSAHEFFLSLSALKKGRFDLPLFRDGEGSDLPIMGGGQQGSNLWYFQKELTHQCLPRRSANLRISLFN